MTSRSPNNKRQPWTPAPHRTPALPKDIGTMWRAVPGGAGSGRCGGRCQGVLGQDDVAGGARGCGEEHRETVPGRCGGRCQGVLGLRLTRLASGREAMPGPSGCQPPRPSVPADASDPGWSKSPLCSSRSIPSRVMKELLAQRREPNRWWLGLCPNHHNYGLLSGTKASSSRS